MKARRLIEGSHYDPRTLGVISKGFDQAWGEIADHFGTEPRSIEDARLRLAHACLIVARDGSDDPVEGFFDSATDATAALAQRMALLGTVRRRFVVAVNDVVEVTPGTVPTHRVIDAEQGLDASLLLSRIEVDLEQETTQLEYLG